MNIRLTGDHLIIRPIPKEKLGLIEMPESLKDDNNVGGPKYYWVMVVGPGKVNKKGIRIPIEAQYGDRVICQSYFKGPETVDLPNGDVIITSDQILLVLPKVEPAEKGGESHGQ